MEYALPPEFDPLLAELAGAPENVRVMWRYAIALLLVDDEKARIIDTREERGTLHLVVQTVAGDRFEVVRPPMSDQTERELLDQIREIMEDER